MKVSNLNITAFLIIGTSILNNFANTPIYHVPSQFNITLNRFTDTYTLEILDEKLNYGNEKIIKLKREGVNEFLNSQIAQKKKNIKDLKKELSKASKLRI